jgi:hypothetical protein
VIAAPSRLLGFAGLAMAVFSAGLAAGSARAEPSSGQQAGSSDNADPEEPDEVIYVDDQAVLRARAELGLALRDLGYHRKRVRNGREIYVNEDPWKPQVLVDDDGWMLIRRAPPSFGKPDLPGIWGGPLGYLVCVANPTACIHIGGWIVSKRKLGWQEHEVVEHVRGRADAYQQAILDRALRVRTDEELPAQLDALWHDGQPPAGGPILATPAERRAALLDRGATRTCTDWGDEVREVVRLYMQLEVQPGPAPFTADEIRAANARRSCPAELVIEGLE